jgi:hypothetical protein
MKRPNMPRSGKLISVSLGLCVFSGMACSTAAVSRRGAIVAVSMDRCEDHSPVAPTGSTTAYDRQVLALGPVLYLTLAHPSGGFYQDLAKGGENGTYMPQNKRPVRATLPNGAHAAQFNGHGQYVRVSSSKTLSVTHTDCLTVEAWIRPSTLQFPREEGTGYTYVLGKGEPRKYEYALRMYSARNHEAPVRPNRVAAYAFSRWGGLGSGAYFQDSVGIGHWMMVAFVMSDMPSLSWPRGYVAIYKNGQLRQCVSLSQYHVRLTESDAPLRIATQDMDSYFAGAIGDVAVYDYALSGAEIASTYNAMLTGRR